MLLIMRGRYVTIGTRLVRTDTVERTNALRTINPPMFIARHPALTHLFVHANKSKMIAPHTGQSSQLPPAANGGGA